MVTGMANDFQDLASRHVERANMSRTIVVLNEEWQHRMYAERDLAVLEERS
jgi:hypothetical protein